MHIELNFIFISKGTKVEIYDVVSGGIVPRLEVPIMGRISVMKSFRPIVNLLSFDSQCFNNF